MPRVSVIIPNYNHARFLDQRIRSVLGQTFQDFEVVILDDASTDNSRDVIQRYSSDSRVRTILNVRNSGSPFAQWNKGVALARGEYLWIAESDDYADARFLQVMESRLRHHPGVDLAYCQSWIVDEAGIVVKKNDQWTDDLPKADRWRRDHVADGRHECAHYLVRKCTIPNASAVLFRKSAYVRAGYAEENFRLSGDWLMWARILMPSRLAFVAEPLNFFRQHSQTQRSRMVGDPKRWVEQFRVVSWIGSRCRLDKCIQREVFDELADCMTEDVIGALLTDAEQAGDQSADAAARYMLMRKYEWQGDCSLREGRNRAAASHYQSALQFSRKTPRVQIKQVLLKTGILPHLVRNGIPHGMEDDNV